MDPSPRILGSLGLAASAGGAEDAADGAAPLPSDRAGASGPESGWRRLPTAWVHFLWVELRHVYIAVFAWQALIIHITAKVYMSNHGIIDATAEIRQHFWNKYFKGYAPETQLTFNGNTTLVIKEGSVNGFGIAWCMVVWILPASACTLVVYSLVCLAREGLWSFENGGYLRFTWNIARSPMYGYLVVAMSVSPLMLLIVWFIGAHVFPKSPKSLDNNFYIMEGSLLSICLLLFSLNRLAFPSTPVHHWKREEMLLLKFRRSLLHFLLGSNASFGMKLTDSLWTAQIESELHGQLPEGSGLLRYFWSRDAAEAALSVCRRAQLEEAKESCSRADADSARLLSDGDQSSGANDSATSSGSADRRWR
mmetsp:Transcript_43833/g.121792  ORF Transcript_43833/g.121792 Transcript_43833/m.121792 type:complete len:365 (-) Transcript_43833:121-1215(-)